MDPFTQRMLERAKARREKLDTQLSNAGHDLKKRTSPLKDANAILAQAPVIARAIEKSPAKPAAPKAPRSPVGRQSTTKSPRKTSPVKSLGREHSGTVNKENGDDAVRNVRSKLHRLGKLYSDDCRELSSPIHKNEENFSAEDDSTEPREPVKSKARLDRLAALASTINNWEDDLSHPSLVKPVESKAEKIQAKLNEQVKSGYEPKPGTSGTGRWKSNSNTNKKSIGGASKPLKWDKSVLDTLEAQGFTRTKSKSRLVYDYKDCSQESKPETSKSTKDVKETRRSEDKREKSAGNVVKCSATSSTTTATTATATRTGSSRIGAKGNANSEANRAGNTTRTPEKSTSSINSGVSNGRYGARFGGYNGSPKSPIKSSPGSVLSKASLFESKGSEAKPRKDPAEMTLSERMALFEKNNKDEAPLVPKAPLTMSVPTKKLLQHEKSNSDKSQHNSNGESSKSSSKEGTSLKSVNANRAVFEQGHPTQELENNILRKTQMERQRELDMLRSRFNRNKESAQVAAGSCIRTSESSEVKSNSPKSSPVCPVRPTPALEQVPPPPPLPKSQTIESKRGMQNKASPAKRQVVGSPPKSQQTIKPDVKRIRVSPPKPGHLYPDLSSIESTETETDSEYTIGTTEPETATFEDETETETEGDYYVEQDDEEGYDSTEDSEVTGNTSLERSILRAVNQQAINKKRSIDPDPDSTVSDISVLDEMDEYLDECLARQEAEKEHGPTPPKLNRAGKSPSSASTSFKYSHGGAYRSPIKITPTHSPRKGERYIVEGDSCIPLMHSVSFYRKQQSQTPKTPIRHISRVNDPSSDGANGASNSEEERAEAARVQEKVKRLMDEICKQQTIIGQASQALNLCQATVEFAGSREQVEGERLLLVATHRRQAALNEVQRLKVEGTMRPVVPGSSEVEESGALTISALTLPLKRDYFRNVDADARLHFLCLVRYLDTIVVTPVIQAENGDSCVRFPSTLKLDDLYSHFKITIEVYSLETRAEILPHEVKYHIHNDGNVGSSKKSSGKTPKKFLKHDSRLIMPSVQSPAGPGAVRTPAFSLAGYVVFSLRQVNRQQFTLNKVPRNSALEGKLQMHVSCELSVSVEHRGFLTMFEDVSGFGAWHRRWCLLNGAMLSYWKYPDDEKKKTPIGSLDLQGVATTNVGLVSRDICARANTFLLETVRPAQSSDIDSLILVRNGSHTTIRHLLSADTKEDRLEWCSKLNKTLNLIQAWGGNSSSQS